MNFYGRRVASLALAAGISAGLLSVTYRATAPVMAEREKDERLSALKSVFFLQGGASAAGFAGRLSVRDVADGVFALYAGDDADRPAYFAAAGEAVGYNAGSKIRLLVGFTGSAADARTLLAGYVDEDGLPPRGDVGGYVVGFSVLSSEETPGLGERIKDARPPYTWLQFLFGGRPPPSPDRATRFQRQFRGLAPAELALRKNGGTLDAITASTVTSGAVVAAIRDAWLRLEKALAEGSAG